MYYCFVVVHVHYTPRNCGSACVLTIGDVQGHISLLPVCTYDHKSLIMPTLPGCLVAMSAKVIIGLADPFTVEDRVFKQRSAFQHFNKYYASICILLQPVSRIYCKLVHTRTYNHEEVLITIVDRASTGLDQKCPQSVLWLVQHMQVHSWWPPLTLKKATHISVHRQLFDGKLFKQTLVEVLSVKQVPETIHAVT